MSRVTVLGTGRMGSAMTRRLLAAGHEVTAWNRTADKAAALVADGARSALTPSEAAQGCDVVLASLSSGEVTTQVLLASDFRRALPRAAVVCDMGTSGRQAALKLAGSDFRFVDAPVSGSVPAVESGQLLVMAGGDPEDIAAVEPVLLAFAKRVIRVGEAGAGQAMKLSVNLVVHTLNSAIAEALALAERSGIEPADAYDVLENASVAAPYVLYKRAAFLSPDTPTAMSLDLVAKDLGLIAAAVDDARLRARALDGVREEVAGAIASGGGNADMAHLVFHLLDD